MDSAEILDLTPSNIAQYGVCGYKDVKKHAELRKKIEWFTEYYPKGLRIKIVMHSKGGYQGMIEYIPGEYAHRPVSAAGFMFIHCIFSGFKSEYKNRGYGKQLLEACINEALEQNMNGVAVVTRKGSFMADSSIFLKRGFTVTDTATPDFTLLTLKFNKESKEPTFIPVQDRKHEEFGEGITVLRSPQCPYTEKNVHAILEVSNTMGIPTKKIDLNSASECQQSPGAFGSFCILHQGEIISHHPISATRFGNIMRARVKN